MSEGEIATTETQVGTYSFTVLRAASLKRTHLTIPKFFVEVKIGDEVYQTKHSARVIRPVWNETFTFTAKGPQNAIVNQYRTSLFGKDVLVGSITKRLLDFEPRNQEMDVPIGGQVTLTLKVGDTVFTGPKCHVYALIIGIDRYASPHIPYLKGSMNDARVFKELLTERLHVPDSQIVSLTNEHATRSAILNTFRTHLTNNAGIEEGDAIVFFYAGHGSRVLSPDGWPATDVKIETLCPYDERMKDSGGNVIHGIPDRTLNVMLRELAAKKGDNITVIFDSCHSGGITRKISDTTSLTVRYVETPDTVKIPESLDSDIWDSAYFRAVDVSIPSGFQHKHMASHVLLAACHQEQYAHEVASVDGRSCGFFTNSLVAQLRLAELDRLTYADLLDLLPELINQKPQCEGENKTRHIFDGKAVVSDRKAFKLVETEEGFKIYAGSLQGIVQGTKFAVQDPAALPLSRKDLGILVALSVDIDFSIAGYLSETSKFHVPPGTKATVSDWTDNALKLKVALELEEDDALAQALFPKPDHTQPNEVTDILDRRFVKVHAQADADIVVRKKDPAGGRDLVIERLRSLIPETNTTVKFTPPQTLNHLPYIFDAIAQFDYQLRRHRGDDPFGEPVSLELFKLTAPSNGARVPDKNIGNLIVGSYANLLLDEEARYGLAMVNRSKHDLFPYLFYFDPSDYSISDYFVPQSPTGAAPLPAQQGTDPTKVTIGYGAGGGDPIIFTLGPNEVSDTGFFKLFVFSRYVDMDGLRQGSAFEAFDRRKVGRKSDGGEVWDSCIVAVTVYKDRTLTDSRP